MMNLIIRKAKPDEIRIIQDLNNALFKSAAERDQFLNHNWPYEDGKNYFKKHITDPNCLCLVAEFEGKIVGYLAGELLGLESWRPVKRTELQNMFVKEKYRNQGIGANLVEEFLKWSKYKGAKRALVVAYSTNAGAINFYKKTGFSSESLSLEANTN